MAILLVGLVCRSLRMSTFASSSKNRILMWKQLFWLDPTKKFQIRSGNQKRLLVLPILISMEQSSRCIRYSKTRLLFSGLCLLSGLIYVRRHNLEYSPIRPFIRNSHRPVAIIHVGPRKTASTALQSVFSASVTRDYLATDNFVYVGKNGGRQRYWEHFLFDCVEDRTELSDECRSDERWRNFTSRLDRRRDQKTNIIISEEGFLRFFGYNEPALDLLADALKGWDVRIVAVYRRYYEWLLSEYSQEVKPRSDAHPKRNFKRIQGFPQWYSDQKNEENKSAAYFPLEKGVLNLWQSRFDHVEVFNMHQDEGLDSSNLIQRFICEIVREAPATCAAARTGRLPISTEKNVAPPHIILDAEIVAVYVQKEEIAPLTTPLDELVPVITQFLNGTNVNVPRYCLEFEQLDDIIFKTLRDEKELVPEFASADTEVETVREGFKQAVRDNRFCSIKLKVARRQWRTFFARLRNQFASD